MLGFRTDDLPLFYAAHGGPPVSARVESADEAARSRACTGGSAGTPRSCSAGRPPRASTTSSRSSSALSPRLTPAASAGQGVTPFVLSYLHRESGGRTLTANRQLIVDNAALAAEVAVAYAAL